MNVINGVGDFFLLYGFIPHVCGGQLILIYVLHVYNRLFIYRGSKIAFCTFIPNCAPNLETLFPHRASIPTRSFFVTSI